MSRKDSIMKNARVLALIAVIGFIVVISGCIPQEQYDSQLDKNRIQAEDISSLRSKLSAAELELKQVKGQLATARGLTGADIEAKDAEIAALEDNIAKKTRLIQKMKDELLRGGVKLPMELSLALDEFAQGNEMVSFDEETGILKFKSDLLFRSGSADVAKTAEQSIDTLASILNSSQGAQFDVIIAGHTDNVPIKYSKAKHPTNWHLSVHRAISVLNLMINDGIDAKRLSVRGFGDQRPIASNETKEGKATNRRVEFYIVAEGR